MARWSTLAVALSSLLVVAGCAPKQPPVEQVPPYPEDLSQWQVPALVQPAKRPGPLAPVAEHKPTAAEKVYDYAPGETYTATVSVGFPLDIIFERGEVVRSQAGGDPEPVEQGQERKRWELKPGAHGRDGTMQEHLFIQANEVGLKMGLIVTTTRRTYYLTCVSAKASPIRVVRWHYGADERVTPPPAEPGLLPAPEEPRQYHVGYTVTTTTPPPDFIPRHIVDDGTKLYLVYPEVLLHKTTPLVRAIGAQGPQILNSRQFLNVVIIDTLPTRLELRVGIGLKDQHAAIVTITQGQLRTIDCPGDPDCPVWPAAAQQLAGR